MVTGNKFHRDKLVAKISHGAESGVVGDAEYDVWGEIKLSVATTFTTSGTLTVQGRIKHSSSWQTVGTLTSGGDFDTFDIDAYDYVRFNFTVAAGSTGEIAASGFFKAASAGASNSFTTIQTDAGTSPVADAATDTLTLTSADASVTITGNSTTDTVDFSVSTASPGGSDTYVQFNDASSFGGDSGMVYDKTNNTFTLTGSVDDSTQNVFEVDSANGNEMIRIKSGSDANGQLFVFGPQNHQVTSATANKTIYEFGGATGGTGDAVMRIRRNNFSGRYIELLSNSSGATIFANNQSMSVGSQLALTVQSIANAIYCRAYGNTDFEIHSGHAFLGGTSTSGTATTDSRFVIEGKGATSATWGLKVQDTGGTVHFQVRDDGGFAFSGGTVGVAQTGYTTFTNLSTDRTCDADATSVAELADILGTLIEDLKTKGIISA